MQNQGCFYPHEGKNHANNNLVHKEENKDSLSLPLRDSPVLKQLLDEVFVISRIIKGEVSVITLTETLIILDITKTELNNYFITH